MEGRFMTLQASLEPFFLHVSSKTPSKLFSNDLRESPVTLGSPLKILQ